VLADRAGPAVQRLSAVNLFAGMEIAQTYLTLLKTSGLRGRLMLTGSENSLSVPAAVQGGRMGLYGATKHALLVMAEWMRLELVAAPIDLHVLMPGAV
jgi:NAD(P)-dependent dehydrogenase (short-subunit alcohol dehydrogenase family)